MYQKEEATVLVPSKPLFPVMDVGFSLSPLSPSPHPLSVSIDRMLVYIYSNQQRQTKLRPPLPLVSYTLLPAYFDLFLQVSSLTALLQGTAPCQWLPLCLIYSCL